MAELVFYVIPLAICGFCYFSKPAATRSQRIFRYLRYWFLVVSLLMLGVAFNLVSHGVISLGSRRTSWTLRFEDDPMLFLLVLPLFMALPTLAVLASLRFIKDARKAKP